MRTTGPTSDRRPLLGVTAQRHVRMAAARAICGNPDIMRNDARMVEKRDEPWSRRSRKALPGFFDSLFLWLLGIFWIGVAFLVGLGVVVTEDALIAKVGGFVAIMLSIGVVVWFVAYLRRPVAVHDPQAESAMDRAAADSYAETLNRLGHVEVALSKRKVAQTLIVVALVLLGSGFLALGFVDVVGIVLGILTFVMVFFLALLPHLEAATAKGPPLRIDSTGIRISRWKPIHVAWDEVVGVRAHANTRTQQSVVIHVIPEFFNEYQMSKVWPLRLTDYAFAMFTGSGFAVPATIDANPRALAEWLDREVETRCPS